MDHLLRAFAIAVVGAFCLLALSLVLDEPEPRPEPPRWRLVPSREQLRPVSFGNDQRLVLRNPAEPLAVLPRPGAELRLELGVPRRMTGAVKEIEITIRYRSDAEDVLLLRRTLARDAFHAWHDVAVPLGRLNPQKPGRLELDAKAATGRISLANDVYFTAPWIDANPVSDRLNVILLSIDTLRADHLGCYGRGADTSPVIDRLAREGVLFRQAIAPSSWTLPSHASMLTGVVPSRHGAKLWGLRSPIDARVPTLAELLWDFGYQTAGFTGGGFVGPFLGMSRGFESFSARSGLVIHEGDYFGRTLDSALPWLERHQSRPFFLFLHTYAVHMPYEPKAPFDSMFDAGYEGPFAKAFTIKDVMARAKSGLDPRELRHVEALYDGEIRQLDTELTRLIESLDRDRLAERTCLIITSDHGEEFLEHGELGHSKLKLFEELVRVPLIFWCPGTFAGGRVIDEQVALIDLAPTILDLLGAHVPGGMQGRSLLPALRDLRPLRAESAMGEVDGSVENREGTMRAVRSSDYKLMQGTWEPRPRLYELRADPGETRDVGGARPDVVDQMSALLRQWSAAAPLPPAPAARTPSGAELAKPEAAEAPAEAGEAAPDAALQERLRALGYMP